MAHSRCIGIAVLSIWLAAQTSLSFARECPSPLGRYARGWSEAVAANGSEFIFGDGSAVMVRHPDGSLTEIETGAMVVGLDAIDDYVYVVGDGGLRIIDLLASGGPVVIGRCPMPGVAESVEVVDGMAFVSGGEWGMRIVDVSFPTDPVELGVIDTPGWAADTAVDSVGGSPVAVVADSSAGLVIVDANDPDEPEVVARVDLGDDGGYAVEATDGLAFAVNPSGSLLSVVDISAPADSEIVESLELENDGNGPSGLAVEGVFAYVAGKNFFVVDISEPMILKRISEIEGFGSGEDAAALQGQVAVAAGSEIRFVDASDPNQPVERETWQVGEGAYQTSGVTATEQHVIGFSKEIFVLFAETDPTPGLRIFDASDPVRPVFVGGCLQEYLIGDAEAVGDLVFVVTQDAVFRVLDLSDVSQPREIGAYPLPAVWHPKARFVDLDVDGDLAVVVGSRGLVVFDITDPADPTRLGELREPFNHVELVGERAYVAYDNTIRLADLTDPSSPLIVDDDLHRIEALDYVSDFEVADGYAFVVADGGGFAFLTVVDVGTETGWTEVSISLVLGETWSHLDGGISLSGDRLVLARGYPYPDNRHRGRLIVFDVSDPGEPMQIADTVMPGKEHAVIIERERIYVSDDLGGLAVYNGRRCLYSPEEPPEGPVFSTQ